MYLKICKNKIFCKSRSLAVRLDPSAETRFLTLLMAWESHYRVVNPRWMPYFGTGGFFHSLPRAPCDIPTSLLEILNSLFTRIITFVQTKNMFNGLMERTHNGNKPLLQWFYFYYEANSLYNVISLFLAYWCNCIWKQINFLANCSFSGQNWIIIIIQNSRKLCKGEKKYVFNLPTYIHSKFHEDPLIS